MGATGSGAVPVTTFCVRCGSQRPASGCEMCSDAERFNASVRRASRNIAGGRERDVSADRFRWPLLANDIEDGKALSSVDKASIARSLGLDAIPRELGNLLDAIRERGASVTVHSGWRADVTLWHGALWSREVSGHSEGCGNIGGPDRTLVLAAWCRAVGYATRPDAPAGR